MNEYITDAFTRQDDKTNLEVNNLNVDCITSKNNKFELDSEGNLTVKSITAEQGLSGGGTVDILNSVYPVGSIYMSVTSTNPGTIFGGVWEQLKDRFLLCCGDVYANGSIGGESGVLLGVGEIPYHMHDFSGTTDGNGTHNHTGNTLEVRARDTSQPSSDTARPVASSANHYGVQITNDAGWHQHSYSGVTSGVGGTQPHNNMPPYLTVYAWKRTQ